MENKVESKKENSFKVLFFGEKLGKKGLSQFVQTGAPDLCFLILVMYLIVIGTVMMFSAGYAKSEAENDGDPYYFLERQLIYLAIGIPAMFIASKIKLSFLKRYSVTIFTVSLILLLVVLVYHTDINSDKGEAYKRWIEIGVGKFSITFQPSDIAKYALVIFLSTIIDNNRQKMGKSWSLMFILIGIIGVVCLLVILENHFSGTLLIGMIGISLLFVGGERKGFFIIGISLVVLVIMFLIINMDVLPDYVQDRLKGWLDRDYDPLGDRWQTNQSLYAIGSGGLFGVGLGDSKQKHLYLPEPHNDFIFAVICEELGFIRTVLFVIIPFALLILRGIQIAMKTKDGFTSLVVVGTMVQVGIQAVLNIGVVTGMLPNTGISLPFFSFGGTALVILLVEMGFVLSASKQSNEITKIKKRIDNNA